MSIVNILYRGISERLYEETRGVLRPKVYKPFQSFATAGERISYCGSGIVCGESAANEVVRHEYMRSGEPTSGISTTPIFQRAVCYATHDGQYASGFIFTIDRNILSNYGVTQYIVKDIKPFPSVPEDEEVILVAHDFGDLPEGVILSVQRVFWRSDPGLRDKRKNDMDHPRS
jgi:hypothetical protein